MTTHKRKITVIGHKNPDTDSICSAIAYAHLKNCLNQTDCYVPKRAGELNAETEYVLNHFEVEVPELVEDIGTQVKDIEIRETEGVSGGISLKIITKIAISGSAAVIKSVRIAGKELPRAKFIIIPTPAPKTTSPSKT